MSTHPVRYLTGPCRLQGSSWPYRHADLRSSCSRWRAISCAIYGWMYKVLTWQFRTDACRAGQPAAASSRWHLAAGWTFMAGRTPSARSPQGPALTSRPVTGRWGCVRASALTRTTSGSRGSGGRTSHQEGSRGALGRWIRIRLTVCHLLGRSLQGQADGSLPRLGGPVLRGRYEHAPGLGVTRKCPRGWHLPRPATGTQAPSWLTGVAVWTLTGPPRRTLL